MLVHDSSSSHSLLDQLGFKLTLRFLDTRVRRKPPAGYQVLEPVSWPIGMAQVVLPVGASAVCRAALGSDQEAQAREAAFETWWNEPLLVSVDGIEFPRRRFIIGAANKEGGAHVDPHPPSWWRDLRDGTWIGAATTASPAGTVPVSNLAPAIIRQITYELLATLEAAGHGTGPRTSTAASATASGVVAWTSLDLPSPPSHAGSASVADR